MDTDQTTSNPRENEAEVYYSKSTLLQQPDGLQFLNRIAISEGSKVLDLGCGTGNLTVELAKRVGSKGHVVGIDPDKKRITVAREKNKQANLSFQAVGGAAFPEDQYDVVFSNYVIHWIENKDAVFKRVYNNLRPGGVFAFSASLKTTPPIIAEMLHLMGPEREAEIEQRYFYSTIDEYEQLALNTGFTINLKEPETTHHKFQNVGNVIDLLFATTYGGFDPALADQQELEKLKEKYANQEIEFQLQAVRFILTKN